ncbi:DNA recombination protein RmuC [bacterium]|nr:DNA recombination protein RmuC [bacterium]
MEYIIGFISGSLITAIIIFIVLNKNKKEQNETFKQMEVNFENLANKVLEQNSEKLTVSNKEKLDDFFMKFKEKIEDFEKRTNEKFKNEDENFIKFDENIKRFIETGSKIAKDTYNLSNIMKSDNRTQGQWGEIVLERVLEASGLRKDEEYFIQNANLTEGRPDAIIQLPENKFVIIDAKTSLASFSAYLNAENEQEKKQFFAEFKNSTKVHISGLAKRDYTSSFDKLTPEYVLMFIPIESCYSLMFCDDNELWDYAWKNKIMPVSPSTLLASLKIINSFLTINKQNKNAQEIARIATKLLDKFSDMIKNIRAAREKIDLGLRQLDGKDSLIINAGKMIELGATMNKEMPHAEETVKV